MSRLFRRHTHSEKLERWVGTEQLTTISDSMRNWYGPPIAMKGVPGAVYAARGGDFVGPIDGGGFANSMDFHTQHWKRSFKRWAQRQQYMAGAGFSSLSDLISESTSGKKRKFLFNKVGTTGVVSSANSLWRVGNMPAGAVAAAAAPGGEAPTDATQGAFPFTNPSGGDTQHLTKIEAACTQASMTLLMYDRIFQVAKTMNSNATEAVSGVPTRYQSTTGGAADSAEGNFLFPECGTVLAATAHNWTVCKYTDQSGNTNITLPSVTGNSGNIVNRFDIPGGWWFMPLDTGDTGIGALTQMQCSAAVATGAIDFVIGHPLAFMCLPQGGFFLTSSLITDAFSLERVFDDACIAFAEIKSATTAATYSGMFESVSG